MNKNLLLSILIGLVAFVNCKNLGLEKSEKDSFDKNTETFLLTDLLNKNQEFLEINGKWKDNYDYYHKIFGSKSVAYGTIGYWEGLTNRIIVEFDNSTRTLYVKGINEPDFGFGDAFNPDCNGNGVKKEKGVECYSRIVWTKYNDSYYYCEIVFNKGSLEDAKSATTTADATNPDSSGCGGSPWTKFVSKLE